MPEFYVCPSCLGKLRKSKNDFYCNSCKNDYPVIKGIPVFLLDDRRSDLKINMINAFAKTLGKVSAPDYRLITIKYKNALSEFFGKNGLKGKRVLDIGAGTGKMSEIAAKKGAKVFAADINPILIGKAKKRGVIRTICDGEYLPFKTGFFDCVLCIKTLHHTIDAGKMIDEIGRILKPGGKLLLYDKAYPALLLPIIRLSNIERNRLGFNENAYDYSFIKMGLGAAGLGINFARYERALKLGNIWIKAEKIRASRPLPRQRLPVLKGVD